MNAAASAAAARPPFRVSHVLLDVDGTLVDYGSALRAAFAAAAARCSTLAGSAIEGGALLQLRMAVGREPAWTARRPSELRYETLRRVLAAHGVDSAAGVRAALRDYELARDGALQVFPEVHDALAALRALGLTLIAASNGNVDLRAVGLDGYLAGRYYADEVGVAKPDARFFSGALARWGIAPTSALAVGDRLDNDYAAARAAGLHAVLLDRAAAVDDPAIVRVRSLAELPALVAAAV